MAQHLVKCKYCGQTFDINTQPFEKPTSNRYAHKKCYDEAKAAEEKEKSDRQKLFNYLDELFKGQCNYAMTGTYIKKYLNEYHYSYSGILKALKYFYEVKGNSIEKANNSIGIVPFVYQDAYNYYYSLWEANQRNQAKDIKSYQAPEIVVKIAPPKRNIKKRNLFTFLDEEEENGV